MDPVQEAAEKERERKKGAQEGPARSAAKRKMKALRGTKRK